MKTLSLLALSLMLSAAQAQTANTPRVDERQARQEQRIDQGIASGGLTQREANKLDHQQDRIDQLENRAKADGQVTRKERAALTGAQNHANRAIARKKHNDR